MSSISDVSSSPASRPFVPLIRTPAGRSMSGARNESGEAAKKAAVIRVQNLSKSYHKGKTPVPVLRNLNFSIFRGDFTAIIGQSGSGKSTLMNLLGTLDAPDEGEIHFDGQRIDNVRPRVRDRIRNQQFGLIFQFYHLLPELSTLENVLLPCMINDGMFRYWRNRRKHQARALEILDLVGLSHRVKHLPRELSGGEMQRTAIARALITKPKLLLADEPTGNLDSKNGAEIINILRKLQKEENLSIVMVTHDENIAAQADRRIRMADGRIVIS
jgi:lipoprotein-releasing system ATP-binding protein